MISPARPGRSPGRRTRAPPPGGPAGEVGPVITLAGEEDLTCAGQLSALITGQLSGGTRQLTIDASGLRLAAPASIRALVLAARKMQERGGRLVLLRPQPPVARMPALGSLAVHRSVHDVTLLQYQRISAQACPPSGTIMPTGSVTPHSEH